MENTGLLVVSAAVFLFAEIALMILLFFDASKTNLAALRKHHV